jgi:hypothetical protein
MSISYVTVRVSLRLLVIHVSIIQSNTLISCTTF